MRILKCPVKSNVKVARDLYEMAFDARDIAAIAQPGQFVNVQCNIGSSYDPLLKALSIYSVSRDYGVSIFYNGRQGHALGKSSLEWTRVISSWKRF